MRKLIFTALSAALMLFGASPAFAADGSDTGFGLSVIGLAIGMGLASAGCSLGQGMAVKSACEGTARNPDAGGKISQAMILGLAFIESLAIYALLVCLIVLFAKM